MTVDQAPHSILMIRPASFGFNAQSADSNFFQQPGPDDPEEIQQRALAEFDRMVALLETHDINVHVYNDTAVPSRPDAIFPNNWVSFHENGVVVLYPLMAENRRLERRHDIIEQLSSDFEIREVIDFSGEEKSERYVEGTGSLVFDYVNRIAYASRSPRTDETLVRKVCERLEYHPLIFDAVDQQGKAIYHTNVVVCVGTKIAVVCLDAVHSETDQDLLLESFSRTGHKVVAISYAQLNSFVGNMVEVKNNAGEPNILLSKQAFESLVPGQVNALSEAAELLPIPIETIEKYGGGSVRCMVAGIYLPTRTGLRQ